MSRSDTYFYFLKSFLVCIGVFFFLFFLLSGFVVSQKVSYKRGKGVCLQDADSSWCFQVLGYLQFTKNTYPASPKVMLSETAVECNSALNSLFRLPAITSLYGIVISGCLRTVEYYMGNSNGSASRNISEYNGFLFS